MAVDFWVTEEDGGAHYFGLLRAGQVLSEHRRLGEFLTSIVFSRGHVTQVKFNFAIENWPPVKSE